MLATRGDHVPTGTEWVHEVKWDGIRALVDVADGVRVWSRSGRDLSLAFPELAELGEIADDLLLDGEIVALGDGGVPSLGGLADRIHITDARK
ncbi:MAG TPA: DNA ligase, partial [Marmoricola sp.]|nr:DNA ligase [Marmoricola sp.]